MKHQFEITVLYPDEFKLNYTRSYSTKELGLVSHFITNVLERIFAEWNDGSDQECTEFRTSKIRSMSVGDFVCINNCWFRVKGCGWQSVTPDFVKEFEDKVKNHPQRSAMGAWFISGEIRWKDEKSL